MNDFKWCHYRGEIILGCVRVGTVNTVLAIVI